MTVVPPTAVTPLRVVVVTNLYPSARRPGWGSFVASRVEHLRAAGVEVEVVQVDDRPNPARRYGLFAGRVASQALSGLRQRTGRTVVEAHIAYPTGLFAWPIAQSLGAPLVLFAHGSDVLTAPHRSRADGLLVPKLFAAADLVVANGDFLAGEVRRLGVPTPRIAVISPGIDYPMFAGARDAAGSDGVLRSGVLYVGHLISRKGPDLLVDALASLPASVRPELTVLGDGPMRPTLEATAGSAPDGGVRVRWRGEVTPADVAAAMARAEVVVVPSRMEPLGLAALEAMAAGAITVVTPVGGLAGLVDDGRTGFVATAAESSAIAAALSAAMAVADQPEQAGPMRMAADAAAATHAATTSAEQTIARYEELLAR